MNEYSTLVLPFENVLDDVSGGNRKVQKGEYQPTGLYPIVDQGQEFVGGFSNDEEDLVQGEGPWIVFGDHTRALKFVDFPFCMGADGVKVLKPRPEQAVDPKYLYHFLNANQLPSAGYSRHYKFLKRLEIPLPPFEEQRRIAAILDKADALRRKRKRALELLDTLTQSIFLDMFGDPVINAAGWPTPRIGDVCNRVTVGVVVRPASYYQPAGVPAIRSLNIRENAFDLSDLVYIGALDNEGVLSKSRIFKGDVVIVRTGQPGKAAVVSDELDGANAIDVLIASTKPDLLDAHYFTDLLNSRAGKALVLETKRGQIQQHLNAGSLKDAGLPVPPLELQRDYVRKSQQVIKEKVSGQAALQFSSALFTSLQHRAFSGQL